MKSSSAAQQRLKLKQEEADECSKMQASGGRLIMSSSLELRLGISSDSDNGAGCGGDDPWLGVGVHPWSLAARQADHQRPPPPQAPVGWPPVGAFRRSHLQVAGATKAVEEQPEPTSSKVKPGGEQRTAAPAPAPASMFVKVNMEGCAVGRKVDLLAHRGYASLSRALQGMFHGFLLSDGQWRIAGREEEDEEEEEEEEELPEPRKKEGSKSNKKKAYILLYEDNEGDRMLVGDVPWELFMASVKRLYIAQDPRRTKN